MQLELLNYANARLVFPAKAGFHAEYSAFSSLFPFKKYLEAL
ncbi:hypothetical protein GIG_02613 [Mycoplasmopsis anatis 1340]|uniref:Uncharacterized protein n=1 Tax=Mycoplasmopsis anatis 1340 TaxID=1034808 RepID=F9QDP9_9BACT|nr:hypothetical protein GIG_02613 [Mycoplasmopsis anatis 1340]